MLGQKIFVLAVAAVSGGGKTTIINQLQKALTNAVALHFDDYDFEEYPADICDWAENGADYNEWNLKPLIEDLRLLLTNSEGSYNYILLDYPFAYRNTEMAKFIDFTIFIDTPLDIAMARRILRDCKESSVTDIRGDMDIYLTRGRIAYLEMLTSIKPNSDYIVDGSLPIHPIVNLILDKLKEVNDES